MLKLNKDIGRVPISFTTEFYKRALSQYNNGYMNELVSLMEQAEIDSHTSGCLMGRFAGFANSWNMAQPEGGKNSEEITNFVSGIFNSLNMHELFEDIFDAKLKKFSVIELEWEVSDSQHIVTNLRKHSQKFFTYNHNTGSVAINLDNKSVPIPEYAALTTVYRRNPVLLSVLRDYILKEYGIKNWLSFIETFGEAFIIGKYPPGADPKFKMEMEDGINALGAAARGVFPQGTQVEIIESKRNSGDHDKFIGNCDRGISITILGHANAVENSKGMQLGSNDSAYQVKREIALSDIMFIESEVNKLVKMIVQRNFADPVYPVFSINKSRPIDIKERLSVLKQAYDQGFKINPDEYAKMGLYKYDDQKPLELNKEG